MILREITHLRTEFDADTDDLRVFGTIDRAAHCVIVHVCSANGLQTFMRSHNMNAHAVVRLAVEAHRA
jgi:hypothetical protein